MLLQKVRDQFYQYFSISILIPISMSSENYTTLIVWDTQTGIAINEIFICATIGFGEICDRLMFHGDQRTITLIMSHKWNLSEGGFYTYDAISGTQLCQGRIQSTPSILGTSWAHKDVLRFAVSFETDGKPMINIYELQPTSTSPLHMVSSFPVPTCGGEFTLSPVSLHASFVTEIELIVLDVQSSQLLLQARVAQVDCKVLPQFSANGHFVACKTLENDIYVW